MTQKEQNFFHVYISIFLSISDRLEFIRYQLVKQLLKNQLDGLPHPMIGFSVPKFTELQEPEGFSEGFIRWVQDEFQLSTPRILHLIRSGKTCNGSKCHDLGDIGSLCCPF